MSGNLRYAIRRLSLKQKLIFSFVGVVGLSAALSAVVFTFVLMSTMKNSTREKLQETSKVAFSRVEEIARGLEIYTDLISSDMSFGQVLSFDSAMGIQQRIEDFRKMSRGDMVIFVPRRQQFVQIRNKTFISGGLPNCVRDVKTTKTIVHQLEQGQTKAKKGWMRLGGEPWIFASKPVAHFGANMGVIFLGRRATDALAKDIASITGSEILLLEKNKVLGSSLEHENDIFPEIPEALHFDQPQEKARLVENYVLRGQSYFSLFSTIGDIDGNAIAQLVLLVSKGTIQEAQHSTVRRVLLVALVCALLSVVVGYLLARAVSRPIQIMTRGIHRITEKGDLSIRIPEQSGAEMGVLTTSFNRLVGQLQEATDKLATSERRMKQELRMASTVQEMLFPLKVVSFGGLELASFIESSTETGGDWFGYAQDGAGKNVSVMIGDVTGHGMPAALITAITNGFFQGVREAQDAINKMLEELKQGEQDPLSTAHMLSILNRILLESTRGSLQMTFLASIFDSEKSELRYANAGHNRPFLCQRNEHKAYVSTILTSPPSQRLGEFSELWFEEQRRILHQGDVIVWYTDGLIECENKFGEPYGKRRLLQILRKCSSMRPEEISERIVAEAFSFYGDTPRKDDITLVVGRVL